MADLFEPSLSRATDTDGDPISGAKLRFFLTETLTPLAVYSDPDGLVSLGSVVTADSAGQFVPVYLATDSTYRVRLTNSDGSVIYWDAETINASSTAVTVDDTDIPEATEVVSLQRIIAYDSAGDFERISPDQLGDYHAQTRFHSGYTTKRGGYIGMPESGAAGGAQSMTQNRIYAYPLMIDQGGLTTVARLNVTTSPGASTVLAALYTPDDGTLNDNDLTRLGGIISFDSATTGLKTGTLTGAYPTLPNNGLVWILVATAASGVAVTMATEGSRLMPQSNPTSALAAYQIDTFTSTYTGTFPGTISISGWTTGDRRPCMLIGGIA